MLKYLFPQKISAEQKKDIQYCKDILISEIDKVTTASDKFKDKLGSEIIMSLIYLKIFSSYLQQKKFKTIEEAWIFVNDSRTIIEKVFYVNNYLHRKQESLEAAAHA